MSLLNQFKINLMQLLGKVDEGRVIHGMQNIRESGHPFETTFKDMLRRQIPSGYIINSGYFYSPDNSLSGEVDIIISLARDSFNLEMGSQPKPLFPYNSVLALFQLKNSYKDVKNAIFQSYKNIKKWERMNSVHG